MSPTGPVAPGRSDMHSLTESRRLLQPLGTTTGTARAEHCFAPQVEQRTRFSTSFSRASHLNICANLGMQAGYVKLPNNSKLA